MQHRNATDSKLMSIPNSWPVKCHHPVTVTWSIVIKLATQSFLGILTRVHITTVIQQQKGLEFGISMPSFFVFFREMFVHSLSTAVTTTVAVVVDPCLPFMFTVFYTSPGSFIRHHQMETPFRGISRPRIAAPRIILLHCVILFWIQIWGLCRTIQLLCCGRGQSD